MNSSDDETNSGSEESSPTKHDNNLPLSLVPEAGSHSADGSTSSDDESSSTSPTALGDNELEVTPPAPEGHTSVPGGSPSSSTSSDASDDDERERQQQEQEQEKRTAVPEGRHGSSNSIDSTLEGHHDSSTSTDPLNSSTTVSAYNTGLNADADWNNAPNNHSRLERLLEYLDYLSEASQARHPLRILIDAVKLLGSIGISLTTAIAVGDVAEAIALGYPTKTVHRLDNDFDTYLVPSIAIPVQILLALYFADPVPERWKQRILNFVDDIADRLPHLPGRALRATSAADSFALVLAHLNAFNATDFFVPISMNIITLMYWFINDLPWGTPLYSNPLGYTAIGVALLIGLLTGLQSYYQSYNAAHPDEPKSLLNRVVTSWPSEAFTAFTNAASFLRPITFDIMRGLHVPDLASANLFAIRSAVISLAGIIGSTIFIATRNNPQGFLRSAYGFGLTAASSTLQIINYDQQMAVIPGHGGPDAIAKFVEGILPGVLAFIVLAMFLAMITKRFMSPLFPSAPRSDSLLPTRVQARENQALISSSSSTYGTGGGRQHLSELLPLINDAELPEAELIATSESPSSAGLLQPCNIL